MKSLGQICQIRERLAENILRDGDHPGGDMKCNNPQGLTNVHTSAVRRYPGIMRTVGPLDRTRNEGHVHSCLSCSCTTIVRQSVPINIDMSFRSSVSRSSKLEHRVSWSTGEVATSKILGNRRSWDFEEARAFEKLERLDAGSRGKGKGSVGPNREDLQTGPPSVPSDSIPSHGQELERPFFSSPH